MDDRKSTTNRIRNVFEEEMKILIFVILFISTALPQSNMLLFFDSRVTTYAGGAKGDGVTDDFLALQTYINANGDLDLSAATGKTFLISQPLFPKSNSTWTLGTATIKMADGDSSMLVADLLIGGYKIRVAEPEKFAVGQWVGLSDDAHTYSSGNLLRYGLAEKIVAISGDTLMFDSKKVSGGNYLVSENARVGQVNSLIICDSIENFTIIGDGATLNGNGFATNQIKVHPVYSPYDASGENLYCGSELAILASKNITVSGKITFQNGGVTHNLVSTSHPPVFNGTSQDIKIHGTSGDSIFFNRARMKNIWIRETDTVSIKNVVCDSAYREDALIFYANVSMASVDTFTARNSGRNGLSWNSSSDSLVAHHITTNNCATGISISSKNAYITKVTTNDKIVINNQYRNDTYDYGAYDVRFDSVTITGATDTHIIEMYGDADTVVFNHLTMTGCTGVGIYVDTTNVNTVDVTYTGYPDNITFSNGDITSHTGSIYQFVPANVINNVTFTNFDGIKSETATYITSAIGVVDTQMTNINEFVSMLKDSLSITNLSDFFDAIWLFANQDSVISKLNLVKRSHDCVVIDTLTWQQWRGWTGNITGGNNYLNTNYNGSTQGINYTLNDAAFGVYSLTNNTTAGSDMGCRTGTNDYTAIYPYTGGTTSCRIHQALDGGATGTSHSTNGMLILTRTASNSLAYYDEGQTTQTASGASTNIPNANFFILARNNNGTAEQFTNRQIGGAFVGKGVTSTQARMITNCFRTYLQSIGAL